MAEQTDEDIARRVQGGDIEAFGELITRFESKLKRYGRKFLSSPDEIGDLVQDVFIKAYTNIQSFDASLRFSPWVYRIAHNTFANELRRKGRHGMSLFDADAILPLIPASETTDAPVLEEEIKRDIDELLGSLSPKYREVIVLHYLEELSYQEIGDVLQISAPAVGVRLTRARKQLRDAYIERHGTNNI